MTYNFDSKDIVRELENRGYIVTEQTTLKNGIEMKGVCVKKNESDRIAPNLYLDEVIKGAEEKNLSLSEVVDGLEKVINREFTYDVEQLFKPDYVANHIRIGVQSAGSEDLIKRDTSFEGIEEYLYISATHEGDSFSVKLKKDMAEKIGLSEDFLFERAKKNNHEEFVATPLSDMISSMLGGDFHMTDTVPMYVISNRQCLKGASAMLDKESLSELADRIGVHEFVLLPSSIHECILVPKNENTDLEMFENMVKEVNANTVDPLDKLVDRAYLLTA